MVWLRVGYWELRVCLTVCEVELASIPWIYCCIVCIWNPKLVGDLMALLDKQGNHSESQALLFQAVSKLFFQILFQFLHFCLSDSAFLLPRLLFLFICSFCFPAKSVLVLKNENDLCISWLGCIFYSPDCSWWTSRLMMRMKSESKGNERLFS